MGQILYPELTVCVRTCLGSYDPHQDYFTDTSVDNSGRSWTWIVYVVPVSFVAKTLNPILDAMK